MRTSCVPLLPEFPSCVFPYQFLMFLLPGSFSFGFSGCSSVFVLQTLVMFYCVAGCSAFVFPTSTQLATAIRFRLDVMRVKQKVDTVTAIKGDIREVPIQVLSRFNHIIWGVSYERQVRDGYVLRMLLQLRLFDAIYIYIYICGIKQSQSNNRNHIITSFWYKLVLVTGQTQRTRST